MQFKRVVISFLLLPIYSLVLAHNLVPHCQEFSSVDVVTHQEKENHHHHAHHQHSLDEVISSDHEHIWHQGHYDEGVYDLLECFLSEIEHCGVEHGYPLNTSDSSLKKLAKSKVIVVLFALLLDLGQNKITTNYGTNVNAIFSPPPLEHSPHRGPPLFTC